MKYIGYVSCKCPYCGYVNQIRHQVFKNQQVEAITCDCDDGVGCGKMFAVRPVLLVQVEVFSMEQVTK